jgi:hypothetical protein
MKKILLLALLISGHLYALQPGLASARKLATPVEQLQTKHQNTATGTLYPPEVESDFSAVEYAPRGLLIFLNHQLSKSCITEAISLNLTEALVQKAGPIIASKNLVHSVLAKYLPPAQKGNYSWSEIDLNNENNPCTRLILKFNSDEWVIKEITQDLYLLIPQAYLLWVTIDPAELSLDNAASLTTTELKLGLKVNHMRTVSIEQVNKGRFEALGDGFIKALRENMLFCERRNYQGSEVPQPLWTLYFSGHGEFEETMAGMSLDDFKKMLIFASDKINVRLLMYQSCYGAGLNAELIYYDQAAATNKTYPFAIATQAITDAPTIQSHVVFGKKVPRPDDYQGFMALVHEQDLDYKKAIALVFHTEPDISYRGNIAQIKLPGTGWFSVVADKNHIVTIGNVLARTRKNPLNVQKYFKATALKALLLAAPYILFDLIIDVQLDFIISLVPGSGATYLQGIRSDKYPIDTILGWFQRIPLTDSSLSLDKMFYIEHIVAPNQERKLTEYTDVFIASSGGAYFKHDSNIFFKNDQHVSAKRMTEPFTGGVFGPAYWDGSLVKGLKKRKNKYAEQKLLN